MQATYNEEELLLRLLLGLVFPFLILVVLRMTRLGLRKWENRWRGAAMRWFLEISKKRGSGNPEALARRSVSFLLVIERTLTFSTLLLVLSLVWFVLFPQTRPLALQLVDVVIAPILGVIGKTVGGIVFVFYSASLFFGAFWVTRFLSGRTRFKPFRGAPANPLYLFPLKIGVWFLAFFLFLFPYPGVARFFAVGMLILAFFVILIALRPVIEEIAGGIYLISSLKLKKGAEIKIGDQYFPILELRSIHISVLKDGEVVYFPYSLILRSETAAREKIEATHGA